MVFIGLFVLVFFLFFVENRGHETLKANVQAALCRGCQPGDGVDSG